MAAQASSPFHVLAKPTGAVCNLNCSYCFFLSKDELYPGEPSRMSDSMAEAYIRQLLEAHRDSPEVTIAWQGGEPTLIGKAFFRRSLVLVERYRRPGQSVLHTIQTNGTLLDDEWAELFAENGFLVGISIDGPRRLHDAYRVDKRGGPTFDKVMRGIALLSAHGAEWNALTTVHGANERHGLEVYRFLRDEAGAKFMQFIPIIERATPETLPLVEAGWGEQAGGGAKKRRRFLYVQQGDSVTSRTVSAGGYGRFLVEVFEDWVRHDVGSVFVQSFDVALANWMGLPPGLCVHSETCGLALAIEHNGDLYSCDHFVEPDHLLGNITEHDMAELVASPKQRSFGAAKRDSLPRTCQECDVRFACQGGCPKDRFTTGAYGEPGLNYLCPSYKELFHHISGAMRTMAELISRGLAPAGIAGSYAHADSARGRNDACPCGSGRKWKQCHGLQAVAAAGSGAAARSGA
ncbi:MAG: anaerobic sulfatase maturase [Acidimicrobiales bacterium]